MSMLKDYLFSFCFLFLCILGFLITHKFFFYFASCFCIVMIFSIMFINLEIEQNLEVYRKHVDRINKEVNMDYE